MPEKEASVHGDVGIRGFKGGLEGCGWCVWPRSFRRDVCFCDGLMKEIVNRRIVIFLLYRLVFGDLIFGVDQDAIFFFLIVLYCKIK